ncbi:hypothetical protein HD554DRAFT_2121606 [Boletus coccyginus]|nr:hypothetical protein HD554DRAFT_2121606 [Boletus coccyginus]
MDKLDMRRRVSLLQVVAVTATSALAAPITERTNLLLSLLDSADCNPVPELCKYEFQLFHQHRTRALLAVSAVRGSGMWQ